MASPTPFCTPQPSQTVATVLGIFALLIGIAALTGWALDIGTLKSILPGFIDMKANAAFAMLLCGGSLCLRKLARRHWAWREMGCLMAGVALLLGLATLAEYMFGWDLGIDQLVFREPPGVSYTGYPNRMPVIGATNFSCLGLALSLLHRQTGHALTQALALITAILSLTALAVYLFIDFYNPENAPLMLIPANAALGFIALSTGLLAATRKQGVIVRLHHPFPAIGFGFGAGIVLFVMVGAAASVNMDQLFENHSRLVQSQELSVKLEGIFSHLSDGVSQMRGFVLTGEEIFLAQYPKSLLQLQHDMEVAPKLMDVRKDQRNRFEALWPLLEQRKSMTDAHIQLYRQQGKQAATQAIATGEGERLLFEIGRRVDDMVQINNDAVRRWQSHVEAVKNSTATLLILTAIIGLSLLIWAYLALLREIAERLRALDSLRMASLVYENSSEAMIVTTPDGIILAVNPAFSRIIGYSEEEAMGQLPTIFSSDRHDSAFYRQMWQTINRTGHWQGEILDRNKNGEPCVKEATINTMFNPEGVPQRRVVQFIDITQRKDSEEQLWHQANFDSLTGLANRRLFNDRLSLEIKKAHRTKSSLTVLLIDLDHFKEVNDTLRHEMGDAVLREVARRLVGCVRDCDTVARLGGDEFTIVLSELDSPIRLDDIAKSLLKSIAEPYQLGEDFAKVFGSIGIAIYPQDGTEGEQLLKRADQAMFASKQQGRNSYSYFRHP